MQEKNYEFKKKWFKYLGYEPHDGQLALHYPEKKDARFHVIVCGRRFGKTWASAMEATYVASQPDKRIWVVGMSYRKARLIFREIWQRMVIGHGDDIDKASEKDMYIRFKWGTTVEAKSADNPDSLVGEGLDLLIMDEVAKMKRKIWDMYLSPTLSDRKGKAVFITTPEGFNWIYDLFLLGKADDLWESHQAPTWDNHVVFPDGKKDQFLVERKRNMSKELYEQEYGAMFTSFEGRVYPFDRNLDMGEFPYNPNYPTFCSIDFGFRMPAVLWFQTYVVGGITHINIIDEIVHEQNIKTDEFVEMIKAKRYGVREYYGDPAGMQAQGQSGLGDIEIFRRNGIQVRSIRDKVSKSIASGVSHVRGFIENAQGQRFVHLDKKCMGLAEDLENYRYPDSGEGKDLKPDPVKDGRHDHSMDAFRYFFLNRFPIRQRELGVISR